ncbi:MAG: cell division protein FtsL [Nitrospirae bacterium]|nr:cell division protein FtsL [Nitrospirota bacterium]
MKKCRAKSSRKKSLLKLCFPLYFVFCLFAIIWLKAAVINLEYELGELDRQRAELTRERKMAVAQRANYYSTEKIEKVALNNLGMTMPMREKVFYVKRETVPGLYKTSLNNAAEKK